MSDETPPGEPLVDEELAAATGGAVQSEGIPEQAGPEPKDGLYWEPPPQGEGIPL
jgi:hypothetical protein